VRWAQTDQTCSIPESVAVPPCHDGGLGRSTNMPQEETPTDCDDALPPPNNADTLEEQLAALTEPVFDHHSRYEAEILTAEFGPPDSDGVYGRNPDASLMTPALREEIEGGSS